MQFWSDDDPNSGDRYFVYLRSIQNRLPVHVFEFASNDDHYNLTSHSSLHDAWLESVVISEPWEGKRQQSRSITVTISLLGPYHDRQITLEYREVCHIAIDVPDEYAMSPSYRVGNGDLLHHEIRFEEPDVIVHDIQFSRGSRYLIKCHDLIHREVALK
jgi:hypothetical protein